MSFEDLAAMRRLDSQGLIDQMYQLPDQLENAWNLGQILPLPDREGLVNIVAAGVGDSVAGLELAAAYVSNMCPLSISICRQYSLPAWAWGPGTLVIVSSHTGNDEEAESVFEQAHTRGCRVVVLTTGGRLSALGKQHGDPCWLFEFSGQPRQAVGFSFGFLIACLFRMELIPDPQPDLRDALHALRNQLTNLLPDVPVAFNPAKRLAGQMIGRWVVIMAADDLEPVARRWKSQINQVSKTWAGFEGLPEADHHTPAGLSHPEGALMQMIALFLAAPSNHPRNQLRLDLTRQMFMVQGINTDVLYAKGESAMAYLWTLVILGDYTSYYLAIACGEDPTPVEAISLLALELERGKIDPQNRLT